jgi:hypothetical protein
VHARTGLVIANIDAAMSRAKTRTLPVNRRIVCTMAFLLADRLVVWLAASIFS